MINLTERGKYLPDFTPFCQYDIVLVWGLMPSVATEQAFRTWVLPHGYETRKLE